MNIIKKKQNKNREMRKLTIKNEHKKKTKTKRK